MPSTRPRINFGNSRVCNACKYKNKFKSINFKKREAELKKILRENKSKNSKYDCIVPWSGGKDSICLSLNLNMVLILFSYFSPLIDEHNRNELINLA